ncbi:oligopeptide/dipeptide ABC transporter, ATP-binding protein [Brachyspira intermedia PWS/A]|uniref:Oligopeptide/dipeptide ABC transporter, ATP-binding protein n=1 Tax=Brachyspira intermedia (strain ATCC 51140 / PWS/A) TaxID=1045858 RepID=G0EP67_BRAIP|nr:ABC transporter ATP-binding protein [Brachyspira intermedia]AEM21937.1 oligopeptide/dipeptide ABC transporter, ATP-binding protein [Brachyspira intermedia PWS/A]
MENILEVENLKMYYHTSKGLVKAINDISFKIKKGETLGIVGESGCGKTSLGTSLLRMPSIPGKYEGGRIILDNEDIIPLKEEYIRKNIRWAKISMVFQGAMNSLTPVYTIEKQMIETINRHIDMSKSDAIKLIEEYLGYVGLHADVAKRYPHELSGGMKQRVVIATALFLKPKLIILDEPTTALDVIVQAQIINLLKKLKKDFDLSFIFITHDLALEAEISDRVCVMYGGKILELANNEDIYTNAKHPYTKRLLAATPRLNKAVNKLEFIEGTPPDLLNPPTGCMFYDRCKERIDKCKNEEPILKDIGNSHLCACHLIN